MLNVDVVVAQSTSSIDEDSRTQPKTQENLQGGRKMTVEPPVVFLSNPTPLQSAYKPSVYIRVWKR
jgi:hypothetical protein